MWSHNITRNVTCYILGSRSHATYTTQNISKYSNRKKKLVMYVSRNIFRMNNPVKIKLQCTVKPSKSDPLNTGIPMKPDDFVGPDFFPYIPTDITPWIPDPLYSGYRPTFSAQIVRFSVIWPLNTGQPQSVKIKIETASYIPFPILINCKICWHWQRRNRPQLMNIFGLNRFEICKLVYK